MLHHTVTGPDEAPPVLWLHGFMGSSRDWAPPIERLAGGYRCLAPDLPGHGASVGLADPAYTMAGTAEALADVLDAHGIGACAVVGYSMGGRVALYFALHHPDRCRRLVLESASPGLPTADERAARRDTDEARARRLETDAFDAFLRDWYAQPLFASMTRHPGLVDRTVARRRSNDPHELARSLRGMGTGRQPSLWERLSALDVPCHALAGALDARYVEIARRMAACAPRLRPVVVPEAGHTVHAERPDAFVEAVREGLGERAALATHERR